MFPTVHFLNEDKPGVHLLKTTEHAKLETCHNLSVFHGLDRIKIWSQACPTSHDDYEVLQLRKCISGLIH
ncbi:hypothetical protein QUC31_018191 [Theobroma cacao]